jgi:C1A family cysteine protease
MEKRKLGWLKQLPDHRDKLYSIPIYIRTMVLPPSVDLREVEPEIYDQGSLGSCTANALAGAYEYDERKQNKEHFMPSRLFIYYNERVMIGTVNSDSGANLRDGIKTMAKDGVCSEDEWPYKIWKFKSKPCRKQYRDALKDQIQEYSALSNDAVNLRSCLADGYPFVFGFSVFESFWNIGPDGIMPMPKPNERVEGGHAVMCVGYDDSKQLYIIRNSWGSGWGDKGYFYMPYQFMHSNNCDDFWTIKFVE